MGIGSGLIANDVKRKVIFDEQRGFGNDYRRFEYDYRWLKNLSE